MVGVLGFVLAASFGSTLADYALPVVAIDNSYIKGTAFLIEPGLAMTAAHVAKALGTAATVRCGDTPVAGVVVKISAKYDLALIRLEWPCKKVPVAKLAAEEPGEGARAFAVGYPGGLGRILTSGAVSLLDFLELDDSIRWVLLVDLKIFPGNSGGPVLSDKGQVIGLVTGRVCMKPQADQPGECYGSATPVSSIHLFLNQD